MLMIDLIELIAGHGFEEMGNLDRAHAAGFQQDADSLDEGVKSRNLREHIVRNHKIRLSAGLGKAAASASIEELHQSGHAAGLGRLRHVRSRINAENLDLLLNEVLQEIAIVASEFDDKARCSKLKPFRHRLRVLARMIEPGVREA